MHIMSSEIILYYSNINNYFYMFLPTFLLWFLELHNCEHFGSLLSCILLHSTSSLINFFCHVSFQYIIIIIIIIFIVLFIVNMDILLYHSQ
jgi:hypothetical protein